MTDLTTTGAPSRRSRDGSCVVFLHVPKTAGSTLTTVFRWQYRHLRPNQVLRVSPHEDTQVQLDRIGGHEDLARLRVLMGHFPFGVHELLPMPCRYITIVRDPVQRVISSYRYLLSARAHPMRDVLVSTSMDLDAYVRSGVDRAQVENALTRQVAGRDPYDDTPVTERDANVAAEHLRTFAAVGLTERFDESLILFKRVLGWGRPFYFSRNVSTAGPPSDRVPDETLDRIRDRNAFDLELYALATSLFRSQVASGGDGFRREVRRFRRMNRVPSALGPVLEPIAPTVRRGLEWRAAHRSGIA